MHELEHGQSSECTDDFPTEYPQSAKVHDVARNQTQTPMASRRLAGTRGHVALSGGYDLVAKLEMHQLVEFSPRALFEVDHVEVEDGLIYTGRLPRSRLFVWIDPNQRNDTVVFTGKARPPRCQ